MHRVPPALAAIELRALRVLAEEDARGEVCAAVHVPHVARGHAGLVVPAHAAHTPGREGPTVRAMSGARTLEAGAVHPGATSGVAHLSRYASNTSFASSSICLSRAAGFMPSGIGGTYSFVHGDLRARRMVGQHSGGEGRRRAGQENSGWLCGATHLWPRAQGTARSPERVTVPVVVAKEEFAPG